MKSESCASETGSDLSGKNSEEKSRSPEQEFQYTSRMSWKIGNSNAPVANPPSRGSQALQRLKRGEITLDDYLDDRADAAVAHLRQLITADQLSIVRETIRNELTSDPELVELIRETTGQTPTAARP